MNIEEKLEIAERKLAIIRKIAENAVRTAPEPQGYSFGKRVLGALDMSLGKGYIDPDNPPKVGTVFVLGDVEYHLMRIDGDTEDAILLFWIWCREEPFGNHDWYTIGRWNKIIASRVTAIIPPLGQEKVKIWLQADDAIIRLGTNTGARSTIVTCSHERAKDRIESVKYVLESARDSNGEPLINVEIVE